MTPAAPAWVLVLVALIAATPPTLAVLVALKRLKVVHTAVNSNMAAAVAALKESREEIANLREEIGGLREERGQHAVLR
jgi:septal ring factor EnvC (AmiA/AmiB activator)